MSNIAPSISFTEPTNTTTEAIRDSTDWSRLSTAQKIKHLEIEGYCVLPEIIPPTALESIRTEVDRLPTKATDYSDNQRGCPDVQWTDSPSCIKLIALPAMLEFLSTLFGDELICTSCHFALSRPGHPGIAIHTDAQPYGSKIFGLQSSSPRLVRVLYYLDDLTPERAPLFKSLNTRKIEYDLPNRPPNMHTEAPGINPSRWNVEQLSSIAFTGV